MTGGSDVPDRYDALTAAVLLIVVCGVGVVDLLLYAAYGQQATISAYLRRVLLAYPSILAVLSFTIGALFSHILLSK